MKLAEWFTMTRRMYGFLGQRVVKYVKDSIEKDELHRPITFKRLCKKFRLTQEQLQCIIEDNQDVLMENVGIGCRAGTAEYTLLSEHSVECAGD